mmetsp:Transcript_152132/g.369466  ORF Transcript_152132/g.369466 Transcript_152132/m.369466 type:complete len:683 (+) Transcript_152132:47-2095(+)
MLRAIAVLVLAAASAQGAPERRAPEPAPLPAAGASPEEYLGRYAGEWVPEIQDVSDGQAWQTSAQHAFMKKYAAEYRSYMFNWQQLSTVLAEAPQRPYQCSTSTCLKEWRDAQLARIKAYVPETWRPLAEGSLNKEYRYFEKRIEAEAHRPNSSHAAAGANSSRTAAGAVELVASAEREGVSAAWYINRYAGDWVPTVQNASDGQEWWKNFKDDRAAQYQHYEEDSVRLAREFGDAPAAAGDCHTLGDLKRWRDARLAFNHAFVPKAFRGFATKGVDDEFERNKARIAKEEAAKASQSANASQAPATLMAFTELAKNQEPASYMGDYVDQWMPHAPSNESQTPEGYINRYAGGYAGDYVPAVRNASDRDEWQQHFLGRYAEADRHYAADSERIQSKFANTPQNASDCHTLKALQQWREAQLARIGAFVPKMWQRMASDSVDVEFDANRARIEQERASNATSNATESEPVQFVTLAGNAQPAGPTDQYANQWIPHPKTGAGASPEWYTNRYAGNSVPQIHNASDGCQWRSNFLSRYAEAFKQYASDSERLSKEHAGAPQRASDARDLKELKAWKAAQLARIHAFVAHTFQGLAEHSVEQAFRKNRARLQQEAASAQNGTQAEPAAAAANNTSLAAEGGVGSSAAGAVAFVLAGSAGALMLALASRMARRCADEEETADVYVQV